MRHSATSVSITPWRCSPPAQFAFSSLLTLTLALACTQIRAATMCVVAGDSLGLQAALASAASNDEDDVIGLQSGQYFMGQNFVLDYNPNTKQHDLTIEGGYEDFFGNPCGIVPTSPDARRTIIDGGELRFVLPNGIGSIALSAITIRNMISNNQHPSAVSITSLAGSSGGVFIRNSMFIGNVSLVSNAINFRVTDGMLVIQNSLFALNASLSGDYPISLNAFAQNGQLCLGAINSSFTRNTSSSAAVGLQAPSCLTLLGNDILWGNNSPTDIEIFYPDNAFLVNDDFGDVSEATGAQVGHLVSVDPLFNSDFSLRDFSPLRDACGASFFFSPGEFDVIGNLRAYGIPDIGAYEIQDVVFASDFDVEWPAP
jgi:hypothetical protein